MHLWQAAVVIYVLVIAALLLAGCANPAPMPRIEFLTRHACSEAVALRRNLDAAIIASGEPIRYGVVDVELLSPTDRRAGYPTPTILIGGRDMFGMEMPQRPVPQPT